MHKLNFVPGCKLVGTSVLRPEQAKRAISRGLEGRLSALAEKNDHQTCVNALRKALGTNGWQEPLPPPPSRIPGKKRRPTPVVILGDENALDVLEQFAVQPPLEDAEPQDLDREDLLLALDKLHLAL